jgi:hypothetical protein
VTAGCAAIARRRRAIGVVLGSVIVACGGDAATSPPTDTPAAYPGFDIGVYPGDAALTAWKYPASPFRWVGDYLPAPCHRDLTWSGKRAVVQSMGWGIAAIYVGQQDWANIPADVAPLPASASAATENRVTCSASLLSTAQGATEAADAIARMRADGFVDGSYVYLDVEHVTTVTQPLLDYYNAWVNGLLRDGHYKPGLYVSKTNAATFHAQIFTAPLGTSYTPPFWIAGSGGFQLIASRPTDLGFSYAQLWQGIFDVAQSYNGVTLTIDLDVASRPSPSAP